MDKILALLGEIKGYFNGITAALAKVTAAEDQVVTLNAELATTRTESSGKDAKIVSLTAELENTKAEVTAKSGEIASLQAAVETEKNRANGVLASQGLTPDQLPGASAGAESKASAWSTYCKLVSENPAAAAAFYAANKDAIATSRK